MAPGSCPTIASLYRYWTSIEFAGNHHHRRFLDERPSLREFAAWDAIRDEFRDIYFRGVTLDDFHFVGISEHFATDVRALARAMTWPRPWPLEKNVTPLRFECSEEDGERIRELHEFECGIYAQALERRERRNPSATLPGHSAH